MDHFCDLLLTEKSHGMFHGFKNDKSYAKAKYAHKKLTHIKRSWTNSP